MNKINSSESHFQCFCDTMTELLQSFAKSFLGDVLLLGFPDSLAGKKVYLR